MGAGTAGSIQMLFGFTGRDWDTDSELQYNRARWFDPKTGRWLSQDPISFAAGDTNLYRYVGNKSSSRIDPNGLDEEAPVLLGPVGSFPGSFNDLSVGETSRFVDDTMFTVTDNGVGILVQGRSGNNVWFIPMLGVNGNGDIVQTGTFVFDHYDSACAQATKNRQLRWIAAAGQAIRDAAGTADIGELPGAGKAVARNIQLLAERRAAKLADQVFRQKSIKGTIEAIGKLKPSDKPIFEHFARMVQNLRFSGKIPKNVQVQAIMQDALEKAYPGRNFKISNLGECFNGETVYGSLNSQIGTVFIDDVLHAVRRMRDGTFTVIGILK